MDNKKFDADEIPEGLTACEVNDSCCELGI